jgi:ribosomal protein L21E
MAMDNFNNQFATQKLREEDYTIDEISEIDEESVTGAGANFIPGKDGHYATPKAFKKTIDEETSDQFIVNKVWDFLESRPFYNKEYMPKFSTAEEIYNEFGPEELKMYSDFDWKGNTEPIHRREKAALHRIGIMDKKSINKKVKIVDPNSRFHGRTGEVHDTHEDGSMMIVLDGPGNPTVTVPANSVKFLESVNENYSKFKTETKTKTNEQQFHSAVRLAEKKIREANKILEYTAQLKNELNEVKTSKNTQKLMERMTKGIAEAYGKMKKLK